MKTRYTRKEILWAYDQWADAPFGDTPDSRKRRVDAWDNYVDHRDHLPLGSTRARRLQLEGRESVAAESEVA